jgi:hypothetical protein
MTSDVCAQTPAQPATTTYVERRLRDQAEAITRYVVSSQRELRDQIGMLQAQIADLSAQLEEVEALVLRLEERTRKL